MGRIAERIGKDQPPFCIGVVDFRSFSVVMADNVSRLHGGSARHVLNGRNQSHDVHRKLQIGERLKCSDDSSCTAHIHFHFAHVRCRFDGDAAAVERHSLADEDNGTAFYFSWIVFENDKPRRMVASFADRENSPHFQGLYLPLVEYGRLEPVLIRRFLHMVCKRLRKNFV